MAYFPPSGSVVAYQPDPSKLQASVTGTVAASIIGAVPVTGFPTNQSVSGTVNIGNSSVQVLNFPTNQSVSGTVNVGNSSVQVLNFPTNQSVSGTVHIDNFSSVLAYQAAGSILAVSGSFSAGNTSVMLLNGANTIGSVTAIQGTNPWIITGSVQAAITPAANQSVSGAVDISNKPSVSGGEVGIFTTTNTPVDDASNSGIRAPANAAGNLVNQFVYGRYFNGATWDRVRGSASIGAWVGTNSNSVITVAQGSVATVIIGGSVAVATGNSSVQVLNFPANQSVSGTINIGTIPGSVLSFQGTNPWVVGSVVTTTPGTPFRYTGSVVSTSVTLIAASVASKSGYITDFWIANTNTASSVATLITFQDGSTSIMGRTIAPAGGGSNAPGIVTPLKGAASQDLAFAVSPAASVIYVTINGYQV